MTDPTRTWVGLWVEQELLPGHPLLAQVVNGALGIAALAVFASLTAMFLVWLERKVSGHFQLRLGPMRTGPHGILQTLADGLKLLFKEWFRPNTADPFTYYLAPFIPMTVSFLILAVLPFSPSLQIADPELGIIYVAAVSGLGVLAILLGSWGSNNKYSLLGGLRAGAQALSYEVSLLLCLLLIVLASGETSLSAIVESQTRLMPATAGGAAGAEPWFWHWWAVKLPVAGFIAFIIFLITSNAELNRSPFDTSEAESELAGGFHTEYSGITFSMFFLAEYVNLFTAAALASTLFLGGYLPPVPWLDFVPGVVWLMLKAYGIIFLFMWIRWTFPRLRIDQLINLEWKFLLPVSLLNLVFAGGIVAVQGYMEQRAAVEEEAQATIEAPLPNHPTEGVQP